MSRHKTNFSPNSLRAATTAGLFLLTSAFASQANAQVLDPVEFGVAQLPYVMILMDTSASMEWTDKGDEEYPMRFPEGHPNYQDYPLNKWVHGSRLNLNSSNPAETVGPCYVWNPQCSVYARPTWCADDSTCDLMNSSAYTSNGMLDKIDQMRTNSDMRLSTDNLPRHIMIKEILAGDMVLKDSTLDSANEGRPGCWFVPRFRDALLEEQVCQDSPLFNDLLDSDDPRPHIQEVYDYRLKNGLLERMANFVLVGVTMFDGYQYDGNLWGMNDILAGDSPLKTKTPPGYAPVWPANETEDLYQNNTNHPNAADYNYNLGIYRVYGPTRLDLTLQQAKSLANYAQQVIADAGYISTRGITDHQTPPGSDNESYLQHFLHGKQPIAGATPLAAAVHDIHQYFRNGQHFEDPGTDWQRDRRRHNPGQVVNPFLDDDYKTCRPKHLIVLTDGFPEPEAPGGAGNGLGSANLNSAFGYNPGQYPYPITEDVIKNFVTDSKVIGENVDLSLPKYAKIAPRVHIIGVNVAEVARDEHGNIIDNFDGIENRNEVLTKMAAMARSGNTCAQYYLPPSMLPSSMKSGLPELDEHGNPQDVFGTCDPDADGAVCLLPQANLPLPAGAEPFTGYLYYPDGPDSEPFSCEHPALVFSKNDKTAIRNAFQAVFNEIIATAGLSARTRPSMTTYLDVPNNIQGQYRMYAGVQMEGSSPYWKGILNQESLQCGIEGQLETPANEHGVLLPARGLHNEISQLRLPQGTAYSSNPATAEDATGDRRRVFTMVPNASWYDYDTNRGKLIHSSTADRAVKINGDEFLNSYISISGSGTQNAAALGTRVPFEHKTLREAYLTASQSPFTATELDKFYNYFKIPPSTEPAVSEARFKEMVDMTRGRSKEKFDRVLGGIFQSNPVTVGPPDLDIPIDSYRAFRARFEDRPTMLYVGTLDGQLHAIYTGQPNVRHRDWTTPDNAGNASEKDFDGDFQQREAWAYIPHMLHGDIYHNIDGQARLLDGSPVVSDVRLCNALAAHNSNPHACPGHGEEGIPAAEQWRTVLVQGLGDAGRGYFALDVTRTGDQDNAPDPIPLWEFNDKWEVGQLQELGKSLVGPKSGDVSCTTSGGPGASVKEWHLPYLGTSVGEAAIGTVAIDNTRRAVAIFSGGEAPASPLPGDTHGNCLGANRIGRAIYVVDLQSGKILRRFVDYLDTDTTSSFSAFDASIVGTPALFDGLPGSLVTRGFVGDSTGRLFRIDLSGGDPEEWKVSKFFDPADYIDDSSVIDITPYDRDNSNGAYGPAAFRPALAMNTNRQLVVIYGLGERNDTENHGQTQFVIALKEDISESAAGSGVYKVTAEPIWVEKFAEFEKLTGEPVIFNNGVYFTTYYKEDGDDACAPGTARIYGLSFEAEDENSTTSLGLWPTPAPGDPNVDSGAIIYGPATDNMSKWMGPSEPTLIRGVAITMGAACAESFDEDGLNDDSFSEANTRRPQLVAQTGSATGNAAATSGSGSGSSSNVISDTINTIVMDLPRPTSQSIPLSWTVITN